MDGGDRFHLERKCDLDRRRFEFQQLRPTLSDGGTINFNTILGYNSNAAITQSGPVVNLQPAAGGNAGSGGYTLTSGTLNFANANAMANLNTTGVGVLTINGGVFDNTSGAAGTLTNIGGGISLGGNSTFNGSTP